MTNPPDDHVRDALAWFITAYRNKVTAYRAKGRDQPVQLVAGRRLATQFFASERELIKGNYLHETHTFLHSILRAPSMSDAISDPVRDALAWFILEDETNTEDGNLYWLNGRRLARQFFSSEEEMKAGHARHEARMSSRPSWPEEMDELPEAASAHDMMNTAAQVREWAKIPGN